MTSIIAKVNGNTFDPVTGNALVPQFLSGTNAPATGLGNVNDLYVSLSTANWYKKTNATTWTLQGVLVGPAGAAGPPGTNGTNGANGTNGIDGLSVLTTTGAPANTVGVDGDYAIDPDVSVLYGPKAAGVWPAGVNLKGANGTNGIDGLSVLTTTGAPANTVGVDGDYAIDPDVSVLYGPKAAGVWPAGVNLKGANGTGSGTVTSVGMTVPAILSVSGSPVTSTGTLAVTLVAQAANLLLAGPATGAAAAPTMRALVDADIPATLVRTSTLGAASGVATLDAGGKLDAGQLPALAITSTFVVADQAAMLALTCQQGDVAVRTDLSQSFILTAEPAATLANWQELLTPTSPVTSVFGRTGSVTAGSGDYTFAQIAGTPTTLAGYGITDAAPLTGTGATGTWGISITGNAATATKLATARTINGVAFDGSANITVPISVDWGYACSDETTALTTGTKITDRAPRAMTLSKVKASLTTASSSGLVTIDVKKNGTSIFSTLLTIDATEKTTATAATAAVLSTTSIADDDEITVSITGAGTGAAGLKVHLVGTV